LRRITVIHLVDCRMSKGSDQIELILKSLKIPFEPEYKFCKDRKFRFDFCLVEHRLGLEYEGIYGGKSRHTTVTGYSKDTEKYNLATCEGWRVLRYTSGTVGNLINDLEKLGIT